MCYVEITRCRSCGSSSLRTMLDLGMQYLADFINPGAKTTDVSQAPLELVRCEYCGLLQMRHSAEPDLTWRHYWYRSSMNQTMRDALVDVVSCGERFHSEGVWVDIGANDGWLLSRVKPTFTRVAFEPARNLYDDLSQHSEKVIPEYFSGDHEILHANGKGACSVITSCAMFYDLDDPNSFTRDIAACLAPEGVWINQLSEAAATIRTTDFGNFCHEHRCYYDLADLNVLYRRHGLSIIECTRNDVNGGSIRVVAKKAGGKPSQIQSTSVRPDEVDDFVRRVHKWKDWMGWLLLNLKNGGREIWWYAASTKSVTIMQWLNQNHLFEAVADKNSLKHGLIMSGSWLPIKSEEEMRRQKPGVVVAGAWAFKPEFLFREAELRKAGTIMIFPLPDIQVCL